MATIDDDLGQIERDIRQLKIEYDQYFGGGRKRPPTEIEWRIDLLVKRYAERAGELSYAQRFRYNNLTQSYAKYKDVFRKRLQQKEEGTVQHHFGSAARAIEAERTRQRAAEALNAKTSAPAAVATAAEPPAPFRMACSEPDREKDKVERLYQAFFNAKQATGEETGSFDRDSFREFVRKKTKDLRKQKGCKEVEYVVEVTGGKAKLKALVKS